MAVLQTWHLPLLTDLLISPLLSHQARDNPSGRKAAALLTWHLSRCQGPLSPRTQTQLAQPLAEALVDCCAGSASDADVYTVQACALALSNMSAMVRAMQRGLSQG